jgi:cysteine desulfurase
MIPANEQGVITLETVKEILGDVQGKFLLCLMAANNETGVIQPLKAVAEYVHQRGGFLHCDAVQALGKMSLNFSDLEVDTISCSVHKIGGPMGVGVLIKKETFPLYSLWSGGGQERGYRSGTENVVSIIGFAEALISAKEEKREQWQKWQQELEEMLQKKVPNVKVFGQNSPRLTNTSCFTMPGVHQQQQVIAFDLAGYAVSAGAACSSGKVKPSHVLEAMGIATDEAQTALRLSWGWKTTWEDLQQFATTWYDIYQNQKKSKEV